MSFATHCLLVFQSRFHDEAQPRGLWTLSKVEGFITGNDGHAVNMTPLTRTGMVIVRRAFLKSTSNQGETQEEQPQLRRRKGEELGLKNLLNLVNSEEVVCSSYSFGD